VVTGKPEGVVGLKRSFRITVRPRSVARQNHPHHVWTWQVVFMAEGVAGLTRDKKCKPGKKPLPTVQRVLDLALGPLPERQPTGPAECWRRRRDELAIGAAYPFRAPTRTASELSNCRRTRSLPRN
jgi:hypothetical protein